MSKREEFIDLNDNNNNFQSDDSKKQKLETNKAVSDFDQANNTDFSQWYGIDEVTYLTHLNKQGEFLNYVFFDGNLESFKTQIQSLVILKNSYSNSKNSNINISSSNNIKGINFICKEPGSGHNNFILGSFIDNNLIIINPAGETKHKDFYNILQEFKKDYGLEIYLSSINLQQHDDSFGKGLVSCGPIVVELMRHLSSVLTASKLDTVTQKAQSMIKEELEYKEIAKEKLLSILPSSLQELSLLEGEDYKKKVVEIRSEHHKILERSEQLKNLALDEQNKLLDEQMYQPPDAGGNKATYS